MTVIRLVVSPLVPSPVASMPCDSPDERPVRAPVAWVFRRARQLVDGLREEFDPVETADLLAAAAEIAAEEAAA